MSKNELEVIKIENDKVLEIFTAKNGLDTYLQPLQELVESYHGDASTEKGRKDIKSFRYKLARSKTYIDDIGKALVSELKKQPKLIDAERKRVRDLIDGWSATCSKPLTDYEAREQARINEIEAKLNIIAAAIEKIGVITDGQYLATIEADKKSYFDFDPQEFEAKKATALESFDSAIAAQKQAIKALEAELLAKASEQEQQRARELENAKEQAARNEKAAEESAKRAEALCEELEEKRTEAITATENAEILQRRAIALEAGEAERKAAEQAQALRAQQKEHRDAILLEMLEDFKQVIGEAEAKKAVLAILKGKIRHAKIVY